ncbi:MAG TPA: zinc ribbon domain-containing protein [Bacillota bacterium]|nr:zinc ribbon domain-containing protein [Bacillota bacterium]
MTQQIKNRIKHDRSFNRYWLIPIISLAICLTIIVTYYFVQNYRMAEAKSLYDIGEQYLSEEKYDAAITAFKDALTYKNNFTQAEIALQFSQKALQIKSEMDGIAVLLDNEQYDKALTLIDEKDKQLHNYQGDVVNELVSFLTKYRDIVNISQIKNTLQNDHTVDDLKVVLWEATAIKNDEAQSIAENIRQEIADYSFAEASEQLNKHHFNDALLIVKDGLKYAPYSDKLQNLQQTIEKEKVAFETAQQERIEQALNLAEEEQAFNKNDAVKVKEATLTKDDQDRLVVSGEIKSQATVPIQSVFVEYKIVTDDGSILETNRVFAFPERLYPKDVGTFEFTHYEIDGTRKDLSIDIEKITWYID